MTIVEFISIITAILVPICLAAAAYFWDIARELKKNNEDLEAAIDKEIGEVRKTLGDWQLTIVSTYATKSEMEKMEMRIITALDRMDVKLDRALHIHSHIPTGHAD